MYKALRPALPTDGLVLLDSTTCKAHRAACGAARSNAEAECLDRSRGGLCSKLHVRADGAARILRLVPSPGQHSDLRYAKLFAHAVRCHWHVENCLHWVLDVVFHEDLSRQRSGAGPQNMATVRHMAMNLLWRPKDKYSLKVRRKSAAWDTTYLEALLRQSA